MENYDTANLHDNAVNNGHFFAPQDGKYLITATVAFAELGTTGLREFLILDSTGRTFGQVIAAPAMNVPLEASGNTTSAIVGLLAGQDIHLVVTHTAGVTLNIGAQRIQMKRLN